MFIGEAKNSVAIPEHSITAPTSNLKKAEKGDNSIDFDKMLEVSNFEKQKEIETEKNSVKDGEFHLGETKDDKDFREQLEKITGKKQDKAKNKLDQNDYLTLLVTQMKYQDPAKPMEHYEMASQMAQFNTVEQLVGVNKALTNMSQAQNQGKFDKLSQYLDKYVEVQGNNIKLNSDKSTSIARFELPSQASIASILIKNPQGVAVKTISLGSTQTGSHQVEWDGKNDKGELAPAGNYTFEINASTDDGKTINAKTSYLAKVNGVTDILSGGKLDTTAGPIDPTKILSVRNYEPHKDQNKQVEVIKNDENKDKKLSAMKGVTENVSGK